MPARGAKNEEERPGAEEHKQTQRPNLQAQDEQTCEPEKKLFTLLDLCVSSLRRGHANLLCIVPILTDG